MTKWIPSLIMWLLSLVVFIIVFVFAHLDENLIIISTHICAFIILSLLFMFIGFINMPKKEDTKYKRYKDF